MIDVETINEKCLIALQALQDIMTEFGKYILPDEFKQYLTDLGVWETNWKANDILREFKQLPIAGEPNDIFVSNDKDIAPPSLWFFFDGYCLEAKNYLAKVQDVQITSLEGKAKWVNIKKENFSFEAENRENITEPTKLQIAFRLDEILSLSAVGVENCKKLLEIYRNHFALLFLI
jgi:hypothetical protein